jgi:CDP-glucose 4,6-dehydratase
MISAAFWRDRNVFVTGGTGLLGTTLTQRLVDLGANVTGLVRDHVPQSYLVTSGFINRINVVRGSVEEYELLERVLNEYEVDTVLHLAAQTIVGTANRNPLSTFESNVKGTWSVLEACRRNPLVKRIVVASSDKAYGECEKLPYDESTPLRGQHPYDVSKSCADLIAQGYHKTFGLPVCVTRCGNFYGPGDLNFNRLIPGTIRSVLRNQAPVIRSDGSYIRDYIYVKDGAEAYLLLAERMEELKLEGQAFNFSYELQLSVVDLTRRILRLMEREDLKPRILNEARNEIRHQYLSAGKAKKVLGWKPLYDLDTGLLETIKWYRRSIGADRSVKAAATSHKSS